MRQILSLNRKWAFSKAATAAPERMPEDWVFVNLPHTWNGIDGQDGGNDFYRGTCWYARELSRSDLPSAERYWLEFMAANASADIYVNGKCLAHHDGGYSCFRVDITDALEDENLIAVAVDNSVNDRVYPQKADFTFYGGLYRDVNLICVPASHFELGHFGTPGIKVTPKIDGEDASVTVQTWVSHPQPGQTIRFTLRDAEGAIVAEAAGQGETCALRIPNVHLWQGRKDPYLYTAQVELLDGGTMLDAVQTRFGCRTYRIDPGKGFFLNGKSYPLRGVCRHQDRPDIGNALLPRHHREDIDLICEVGANTVRLAHYQHNQTFYDLCDERGLIVWAEIPYISAHMANGRENTVSQMTELITQNYNHPSIVVWGLSNEITMVTPTDGDMLENHRILNDLCHRMDPTRPTVMAVVSMCAIDDPIVHISDVVSYNLYFGWYGGTPEMNGPWLDAFHARYPDTPIGISEYGAEALNWHSGKPVQGDYTEDYQALYHEQLIKQLYARPYIWATHVWNMFDFAADARAEGGEDGMNHKGLVSFDRKYMKDAFYAYKAWLSDEPFVHIGGKRYVDRVENPARVTVYSNQPEVELFANGVSLGRKTADDHFFRFEVPNTGETRLTAVAGSCRDESVIRKVDQPNPAYILYEKGAILNWTDITEVEGCYSLNDTIGDICKSDAGKAALLAVLDKIPKRPGHEDEPVEQALKVMGGFTVMRLIKMSHAPLEKEELLELNSRLNTVFKA